MRKNTAWAFAGNSVYAACQWAVFVLLVKRLAAEDAGAFAYATAVTGPVFVLANLRLRNLLATRVGSPDDFADYLTARLLTIVAAVLVSIGIGALVSGRIGSFAVLAIMTAGRSCDALSDVCHGLFQRELDMRRAAIGLTINGVLSVLFVVLAVFLTQSIALATTAYAAGSFAALAAWDLPQTARAHRVRLRLRAAHAPPLRQSLASAGRLIATALPLGLSSAIGSVQTNVPRYVVAASLGPAMLARFAAISYVTLAGHLIVNAVSQAALPMLATDVQRAHARYRRRLAALVAGTLVLGGFALTATLLFGRTALTVVYGREYAQYNAVLVWLVAATVVTFTSVFLGTGTTARQRFTSQFVISAISLAVVAASVGLLVSRYGLVGAAASLLAGAAVEFCAYAVLTVRDLGYAAEGRPPVVVGAFAGGAQQ